MPIFPAFTSADLVARAELERLKGRAIVWESLSDLPTPDMSGVISVPEGWYKLTNSIILPVGVVIVSTGRITIESSNKYSRITANDPRPAISTLGDTFFTSFALTNLGGPGFYLDGNGDAFIELDRMFIQNCNGQNVIRNTAVGTCTEVNFTDIDGGLRFEALTAVLRVQDCLFADAKPATFTYLELAPDLVSSVIRISDCSFDLGLATVTAFDFSAAISPISSSMISGCQISSFGPVLGTVFMAGSADQTNVSWRFMGNAGIKDSQTVADFKFEGNTLETPIAAKDTPYDIASDAVEISGPHTERFTLIPTVGLVGSVRYDGLEEVDLILHLSATLERSSTGDRDYLIHILQNGVQVPLGTVRAAFRNSASPVAGSVIVSLKTGDIITLKISQILSGSTRDIRVETAHITMK